MSRVYAFRVLPTSGLFRRNFPCGRPPGWVVTRSLGGFVAAPACSTGCRKRLRSLALGRHLAGPLWPHFMSSLYDQLRADIITAMKARDSAAATALRTADAGIKRTALDSNKEIDDAMVIATLRKSVKNLADAKADFEKAGRADLVAANDAELKLLEKYLPKALDPARVDALIAVAIQETGAQSKKDMGKVIGALKKLPEAGLIDFGSVSKLVQAKLP